MGFHGHLLGALQVILFAPCLRPYRAEDRRQIKSQLGEVPVIPGGSVTKTEYVLAHTLTEDWRSGSMFQVSAHWAGPDDFYFFVAPRQFSQDSE